MIAGDLTEITINHPDLGDFKILIKSDTEATFDLGGIRGADESTNVDGGGRNIRKLNRKRWSVEAVPAWDMNTSEELEKISQLAAHPVEAEYTFTHINGAVYAGTGAPVGDPTGKTNDGTIDGFKISGGGVLTKISG